jgi:hypothetical protein
MSNRRQSSSGSSIALLTACILGVAGAVLFLRQGAKGADAVRAVESIAAREARNTFGPAGEFKQEGRPVRIFIIKKGDAGGVIEGFNAANNDKLRIEGFGLTRPETVKALMHREGRDTILMLPGGTSIRLAEVSIDSFPDASFQLELDRTGLVETFADDFNSFSWYAEGLAPEKDRQGTWRTNYGWQKPDAEGSRSLAGESEIYADAAFKGTSPDVLGLNPFHLVKGTLEIWGEPAPERVLPFIWGRRYVSGIITTKYSFSQLYGVFEIRARLPKGRGFWPAFWLMPADSTWPPELDVFEVLGHETTKLYTAAHSKAGGEHTATGGDMPVPDLSAEFHQYAVEWQKDEVRWYFDGVEIERTATPADMQKPMYLLANLAVGAGWPGQPDSSTQFPGVYAIDWIRAYRRAME